VLCPCWWDTFRSRLVAPAKPGFSSRLTSPPNEHRVETHTPHTNLTNTSFDDKRVHRRVGSASLPLCRGPTQEGKPFRDTKQTHRFSVLRTFGGQQAVKRRISSRELSPPAVHRLPEKTRHTLNYCGLAVRNRLIQNRTTHPIRRNHLQPKCPVHFQVPFPLAMQGGFLKLAPDIVRPQHTYINVNVQRVNLLTSKRIPGFASSGHQYWYNFLPSVAG